MMLSLFLAKVFGIYFIIVALSILINHDRYVKMVKHFIKNEACLYISGVVTLVLGLLVAFGHNRWMHDWTLLITILGWAMVVKGTILLLFPEELSHFSKKSLKGNTNILAAIIALLLGLYLAVMGFTM